MYPRKSPNNSKLVPIVVGVVPIVNAPSSFKLLLCYVHNYALLQRRME
jgi:hypothetical protein